MDEAVLNAQKWLNATYNGKNGYSVIDEDGMIGSGTVKALIIALQIEEGETNPDGIFGKNTASKCPELSSGYTDTTHNYCKILQHGLYCKGYSPTAVTGYFGPNTKAAIESIQSDAGISPTGVVNGKLMKQILSLDALVNKGDEKIREIQRALNGNYLDYFDIIPTDGRPSRQLAKGLIYALQAEEGLSTSTANGTFGPTTKAKCPTLSEGDTRQAFVKILQYALYINGKYISSFSGIFDSATKKAVEDFQRFACLPVGIYGTADLMTWLSLLTSSGDSNRATSACDASKTITDGRLAVLHSNNYHTFGRYLTGTYAMSADEINRVLGQNSDRSDNEIKDRIFPIFQRTGCPIPSNKIAYFTPEQGETDGKEAVEAAFNFGFKDGTMIFFASDVDAYDYQVKEILLPYYKKVKEAFDKYKKREYIMGLYGPRNTCIQVCDAGYASACFVSDMSTGYSGNLGYPLPNLWAFDQFAGDEFGETGDADYIDIDKVAVSGYYLGESEIKLYDPLDPYENKMLADAIKTAVYITAQFETSYGDDISKAYSCVSGNHDGQGMSFGIIQYNFGQETLQSLLKDMIAQSPDTMSQIFGSDYETLTNILNQTTDAMIAWANEISTEDKSTLISPWREYFHSLGENELCRSLQQEHMEPYWRQAIDPICKNYGIKTCRGYALAFDIAVNRWALGNDVYQKIMEQVTENTTEKELLQLMVSYDSSSTRARREAILNGSGRVNNTDINLEKDYGLNDTPFRE
ncbi:glycoside hydrolase domain-containing protein [uncultured Bacteroides sp.]|uniref:glycoside hydrolase domain-containing protein n=1 Tax=uncultured Bacteroides sp. TaxID=162156 RepID=UPI0026034CE1|nr:glycoside hydrolase domain-containing protein [uncultured Bacteroides sp.]